MQRLAVATTPMGVGFAALALRAVAGAVVAYHGYQKVDRGVGNFAASVTDLQVFGLNLPFLAGYLVVVVELVGGLCLLAGLATRVWSILVAIQFMAIPFVVKSDVGLVAPRGQGTGFELDLLVAACAVALLLIGPGPISLDRVLRLERPWPGAAAP